MAASGDEDDRPWRARFHGATGVTTHRLAVSEWAKGNVPGFMAFDGRWKLLFGRSAEAASLDALYDFA